MNKFPEFYFSTASIILCNPVSENHPVVKPFMFIFTNGNKRIGPATMKKVNTRILYTAEACYWLAHIYIKHELKPKKPCNTPSC
jgi:hypothetical protein